MIAALLASRRARRILAGIVALVLVTGAMATAGMVLTAGWIRHGTVYQQQAHVQVGTVGPGCMPRILATTRTIESSGRYNIAPNVGGASGAYQFIDSTWQGIARRAGIDISLWPQAWMAPAAVQDQVAAFGIQQFLDAGNPVQDVPVYWYYPAALADPTQMDLVPYPDSSVPVERRNPRQSSGGNTRTPREYQTHWMREYARQGGCAPATPAQVPSYAGDVNQPAPSTAMYPPGQYPLWALTEVQPGRFLAPEVAAAWRAMAAAAAADGITLRITSAYRSLEEQQRIVANLGLISEGGLAAPVGRSPHQLATAADMDVIPGGVFDWLNTNAPRWCFGNLVEQSAKARERWHWAYYGHIQPMGCTPESVIQ